MADTIPALTKAIGFMAEFQKTGVSMKKADLPSTVAEAARKVENDENIPVDDPDTTIACFHIPLKDTGIEDVYVVDHSGDDPDQFRIVVAIQDSRVIGVSSEVAS